MAEALLRRRLDERGAAARVESAGFLDAGQPAAEEAVATMAKDGYDLTGHLSQTVTPAMVGGADLALTMAHQHVVELGVMVPDDWSKIFQLRDFLRRAELAGSRRNGQPFSTWLEDVGTGRTRAQLLGGCGEDDIADPIGQPQREYDRTKYLLDELLTELARLIN